jgi:heterotetrameric sarcosine oxidase beta subunit/heterotetrameric sarcosine oxidase delta subunit
VRGYERTAHANALQGSKTEFIGPERVKELCPIINLDGPRYPVLGALWQARGGTARHDAVAWGYARACSDMGMDIIQKCEVTGIRPRAARSPGVSTTRAISPATSWASWWPAIRGAGRHGGLPPADRIVALQALVSEPIKPCMDVVVMANTVHGYMSQSDKGEMVIGGGADGYNNYTQRGSFHHIEETVRALIETFPMISRLKMLRQWGGIVDMTGDRSPIMSKTPAGRGVHQLRLGHRRVQGDPRLGWATARHRFARQEEPAMLLLECPYCGVEAEETELHPGGEAHLKRQGPGSGDDAFADYLFTRKNPRGVHFERWRHVLGCGKWFHAARDTATLEVFGTYPAQTTEPPDPIQQAIRKRRPDWEGFA